MSKNRAIGDDSTLHRGSGKNTPVPTAQPGQNYFARAIISTLLYYTKMAAISELKIHQNGTCGQGSSPAQVLLEAFTQAPRWLGRETSLPFPTLPQCLLCLNFQHLWHFDSLHLNTMPLLKVSTYSES